MIILGKKLLNTTTPHQLIDNDNGTSLTYLYWQFILINAYHRPNKILTSNAGKVNIEHHRSLPTSQPVPRDGGRRNQVHGMLATYSTVAVYSN